MHENGTISINTENIFPIIKKWLYSEKDIFLRELVSNSSDAISKFKKLVSMGEAQAAENTQYKVTVELNKDAGTIKISDNGIGMTAEEVKKYINQIAFSGAVDFMEKYKDKADGGQIIGHFGLGFYSAFMVSDKVTIDTLSYIEGEEAVKWVSADGMEYTLEQSERKERGTTVTLYLSEDSKEFTEEFKLREILYKYCSFLPYELYFEVAGKEKKEDEKIKPLNDIKPLWLKNPKDCSDEEYKDFYRKVFMDFNEPLFWIHLNMDYPFNLKGILYFPKLKHEFETMEGQIKLYYNQIFVADNIKEVIPEFLLLLKGAIDCPDLPLNVSRSFLQNDAMVATLSAHITKKVADKLTSLFENERDNFNKYWDDINPFVKYGCIKEKKFYDRVKDILIFKTINDSYVTLKDYLEAAGEKHKNQVFYVTDEKQQAQYVKLFKDSGLDAVILNTMIDNHFISFLEMNNNDVKFLRIDSDLASALKSEKSAGDKAGEELEKAFKESLDNQNLKIKVESLKTDASPAIILLSEQNRRMAEMSRNFGGMDMAGMFPQEETLVLNESNSLIKKIIELKNNADRKEDLKLICKHVYDLALMAHKQLDANEMSDFIKRSTEILGRIAG